MTVPALKAHENRQRQLSGSLGLADRLIEAAEATILPTEASGPDTINLPPVLGAEGDQARLRSVSPLYLCSELENANLLGVVEKLASLFALGALSGDPGHGADLLAAFWQKRNDRFTSQERQALFSRLFGETAGPILAVPAARNEEFLPLMIDFAGALAHVGSDPLYGHTLDAQEAVRISAEALAVNLVPRSGGITLFAAREITSSVREAVTILESSSIQAIVGARTVWGAVAAFSRAYLGQDPLVAVHVDRGRAGALLLAWLAESSTRLESAPVWSRGLDNTVLAAASAWVETTMALPSFKHLLPVRSS